MIRLTNSLHESEWITPESIARICKDKGAPVPRTRVYLQDGSYVVVTETRQEIARKVLEWKYIMQKGAYTNTQEMARLRELAGLEESGNECD